MKAIRKDSNIHCGCEKLKKKDIILYKYINDLKQHFSIHETEGCNIEYRL